MKPHEEVWREGTVITPERARLALQAPAMARLLLQLEWEPEDDTGVMFYVTCGGQHEKHGGSGHRRGCDWQNVLRAAGVLP